MKTGKPSRSLVFVFVPVDADGENMSSHLRELATALFDAQSVHRPEARIEKKPAAGEMPLWTWFLPNPRPGQKNADL